MCPSDARLKTIAVIPCLNEERFISEIVSKTTKYVDTVVVIDDGSTDGTANAAANAGAEVIRHAQRQGAGAATRSGFAEAIQRGADVVVTLDGDGQHNPDEIPALMEPALSGTADLIIGSRFLCDAAVPRYRKFGIDIITSLYNMGHKVKIADAQSGFRAYSRKALDVINISYPGFEFSVQSLVQVRKHGLRILEVPISCIYHDYGSSQNPLTHGLSVAWAVVKIRITEDLCKSGAGSSG